MRSLLSRDVSKNVIKTRRVGKIVPSGRLVKEVGQKKGLNKRQVK